MENQITIREAVTENDAAAFWEQLHAYHKRDIFTDSDKEELEYFLGQAYRDHMMRSTAGRRIAASSCSSIGADRISALLCR